MIENITKEKMEKNTSEYIKLLESVDREGIQDLIEYLKKSDFFTTPASTKYHGAFEGGLCEHTLWVYRCLKALAESYKNLSEVEDDTLTDESIIIAALLHDISKIGMYELSIQNKKIYSENGSKYDELGKYDWKSVPCYKKKEDTFVYINHEMASEFIARQFIPLRICESVAIAIHHGGVGYDTLDPEVITPNYNKYTLSMLLHQADMMAAYKFA